MEAAVESVRLNAVARTVEAVAAENTMTEPGASKTNGQRRGNEKPTPESGPIEAASQTQFNDLMRLVREEVLRREAVVEKGERLKSRRPAGRA
jgi:hypothetical protein